MKTLLNWLLTPHPDETEQDIWYQEEARAERVANLMRIAFLIFWLPVLISINNAHPPSANFANIGLASIYLLFALALVIYLRRTPYSTHIKYVSITIDIFLTSLMLFLYHYDMGYSTSLKAPPFINYLAVIALAAFRFNSSLAIYGGILASVLYALILGYMLAFQPVEFGTPLELFTTPKINMTYQLIRFGFLIMFSFASVILTLNVQRLVQLRVKETEIALEEKARRQRTQGLLERYFTPEIARYLTDHPQDMGGVLQPVTVVVADLRNFTGLSERIGPAASVELLNTLFERLTDIIFAHEGTLDKFLGDGLLAVFGTPSPQDDDALRAVSAAQEMAQAVKDSSSEYDLSLGVGVHSGEAIFGNVGSPRRMELTVIGDVVNTTSRIEALNKDLGTTILISETTYQAIHDHITVRELPAQTLRGKTEQLRLYTLP